MAAVPEPVPSAADIAAAWRRERPGTPTESIEVVTPIRRLAKLFADDRARVLREAGVDAATLDLLSVIRRSGPPYTLSTRELARRTLVTAGAISQRVSRAERDGLVRRGPAGPEAPGTPETAAAPGSPAAPRRRTVLVTLTAEGHACIERTVDRVLGREAELVDGLTDGERGELVALLEKLTADVRRRTARGK